MTDDVKKMSDEGIICEFQIQYGHYRINHTVSDEEVYMPLKREILARLQAGREARELLKDCDKALLDWMRMYAPDEFTKTELKESRKRIQDNSGVLGYIANLRKRIKEAGR